MTCIEDGNKNSAAKQNAGRRVTDCLWLTIFICFCFGMVFIAAFAIVYGNPLRLVNGYDSFGNMCGYQNEPLGNLSNSGLSLTDEKYLFFFNIATPFQTLKICVRQCPSQLLTTQEDVKNFGFDNGSLLCRYDIPLSKYTPPQEYSRVNKSVVYNDDFGPCPPLPIYPSSPILNRCIPTSFKNLTKHIIYNIHAFLNDFDLFHQVLSNVYETRKELLILAALSCVLSSLMVLILHFLVTFVFWIIFIGVSVACCAGTGFLWWTYIDIKNQLDALPKEELLEDMARNERAFLCYSIIATICSIILLTILCCFKREMPKVKILFNEAASCMYDLPFLFFQPVWTMAILFCFIIFWIYIVLSLATANMPSKHKVGVSVINPNGSPGNESPTKWIKEFTMIDFIDPTWVRYFWWYYIFALIWMSEVILSCQKMIMAGTIAKWYFAEDRNGLRCPLWKMTITVLIYHMGSVAKGSFLIALFKLPRILMTYIKQKIATDQNSNCAKCCQACCCCCLWMFEKFIKYMNHNAYTVIALNGDNFCSAAVEAFTAIVKQSALVATVNSVGDFVLFLAKCLVTILTGIAGLFLLNQNPNFSLRFYAIPLLISCIIAYYVAHCILSLFEMIIDTLTLCYCEKSSAAPEKLRVLFKSRDDSLPEEGIELDDIVDEWE